MIAWVSRKSSALPTIQDTCASCFTRWASRCSGPRRVLARANAAEQDRWHRRVYPQIKKKLTRKTGPLFVDVFLEAFEQAPEEIVLDLDTTDLELHGGQEGRFFHGYYDEYCYLPLYIFCGEHVLCARLRQANIDASAGSPPRLMTRIARGAARLRPAEPAALHPSPAKSQERNMARTWAVGRCRRCNYSRRAGAS
jgi:hypothetical protein